MVFQVLAIVYPLSDTSITTLPLRIPPRIVYDDTNRDIYRGWGALTHTHTHIHKHARAHLLRLTMASELTSNHTSTHPGGFFCANAKSSNSEFSERLPQLAGIQNQYYLWFIKTIY